MFFVNCNNLNTRPLWIPAFAERATLSKFSIYLSKTYYSHKQFHPPNHLLTHPPILPITYLHHPTSAYPIRPFAIFYFKICSPSHVIPLNPMEQVHSNPVPTS